MRLTLIRTAERCWRFLWSHHHILLDGWCVPLILKDVFACYAACTGRDAIHLSRPRPYRNYVAWLAEQDLVAAERYWRTALAGFTAPTPLIVDQSAEPIATDVPDYGVFMLRLSRPSTTNLHTFAQRHQLTVNTVVQGAWALLLNRYSGEEDVVFGATVSGRSATLDGIETMVGLLINTVPVRVTVPSDRTVLQWLKKLFAQNVELRQHEHTPLIHVQKWSDIARGQALFDSVVVFENYPLDRALDEPGSGVTVRDVRCEDQTNYPLTVNVHPGPELIVRLSYDRRRFDAVAIERLAGHLEQLLHALCTQPHARLSELSLTTAKERRELVTEWNATQKMYDPEGCVHELIEAQVERMPEAMAVVFGEKRLTYRELNGRANQLAWYLRHQGIRSDMLVGVCLERSVEMVVALLGILKAGAAYVPIDPDYPSERIAFMLDDADTSLLLTHTAVAGRLPAHKSRVVCLDRDWSEIAHESDGNLCLTLSLQHLAYTIYTSGSTGRPKGAGIPHAGLRNRLLWMQEQYGLSADDRVLQKTPFSFDVSVWEFFWPLMAGASLIVAPPGDHKNAQRLVEVIVQEQITTLHFVPPMLQAFLDTPGVAGCQSLRRVICSGEALPVELQRRFFQRLNAGLHNLYGPTEASIDVTAWVCRSDETTSSVPIGRPIANTEIYLLDRQGHPAPIGVSGELYIGGVGLARAYHRRPDLTAEKFVPDPFSPVPGRLLYRTGDLARYRSDGAIEFLGRLDHQVKIRGFRIELGEIEAWLNTHPSVRESIVLAREDHPGAKRLVAYVVGADGAAPDGQELQAWSAKHLPDYMVPSMIMVLGVLPLTPNGKVDRRALPAPDVAAQLTTEYVPPRTATEQVLADIWADVLHVERVGANDDFFELGGDSIISLQIIARAHQSGLKLTPKQLFEHRTVGRVAAVATLQEESVLQPKSSPVHDFPEARLTEDELNNLLEEMK
jgi:amino acid adenylation domain-containing protein